MSAALVGVVAIDTALGLLLVALGLSFFREARRERRPWLGIAAGLVFVAAGVPLCAPAALAAWSALG